MSAAFADRRDAGRRLGARLSDLAGEDVVVLALPRGGVPVGAEVAAALGAPLDVLVVGKVGVPGHEELALAAVADDGHMARNPGVIAATGLGDDQVDDLVRGHVADLAARGRALRGARAPLAVADRVAVVVDDGMATGATMRVALEVVRGRGPASVVAAVPVASPEAARAAAALADRVECVLAPAGFRAVGPWYDDFTQVSDDLVRDLLALRASGRPPPGPAAGR